MKKNCKRQIQNLKFIFRIKKVTRRKRGKLYGKWKGYDGSFNIWIDNIDVIM